MCADAKRVVQKVPLRQQPFPHLALGTVEHRFHIRRIKTGLSRTVCVKFSL